MKPISQTLYQNLVWKCCSVPLDILSVSRDIHNHTIAAITLNESPSQQTAQWLEILQRLCLHSNPMIQHRGLATVNNMLNSDDGELAKKLIESELLEIMSVIGKAADNPKRQDAIDAARSCLVKAMDLGLIKPFSTPS